MKDKIPEKAIIEVMDKMLEGGVIKTPLNDVEITFIQKVVPNDLNWNQNIWRKVVQIKGV